MGANSMRAYYNENDPFAAEWSRELIREGEITEGKVDGRSIVEVEGIDVAGYERVHLFAGIDYESGSNTNPFLASMAGAGLNPAFSRWLQGFPAEWCEAAIRARRSMPTRRRKRESEG